MSYSEILQELARKNDLQDELIHPIDQVLLTEILEEIPHKPVLMTQVLFAVDQIQELIKLTHQYNASTGFHLGRVGRLAAFLAKRANLPWITRLECLFGGWIHDIGKIYVNQEILNKPGKLTTEEYDAMKLHVLYGVEMLQHYPHLETYSDPIRYHHERYDGRGYPYGLAGTDIPLSGRVTGIVDAYDAMTSSRPYSSKKPHHEALAEIERCAGAHFDPDLAAVFCRFTEQEIELMN